MADSNRRARAKGRRGSRHVGTYAMLPNEVLRSVAYRVLPDSAKSVLVALAAQYRGNNNGDLSLVSSMASDYGITYRSKLFAGLELLLEVGLVVKTRQGGKSPMGCTLYALTWWGIHPSDKYDAGIKVSSKPTHLWANWVKPPDWKKRCQAIKNKQRGRGERQRAVAAIASLGNKSMVQQCELQRPPCVGQANAESVHPCGAAIRRRQSNSV